MPNPQTTIRRWASNNKKPMAVIINGSRGCASRMTFEDCELEDEGLEIKKINSFQKFWVVEIIIAYYTYIFVLS